MMIHLQDISVETGTKGQLHTNYASGIRFCFRHMDDRVGQVVACMWFSPEQLAILKSGIR